MIADKPMLFEDIQPGHTSFAKDPCVVWLNGLFYLYYSKPCHDRGKSAWGGHSYQIGIARGHNLSDWEIVGETRAEQPAEGAGICAPGAVVLDGVVHLFYQSYGQFPRDFICHATSTDGVSFTRDPSNPVVMPRGDWNNGRAIDADVVAFNGELLLYWATRDPTGAIQMLGVSSSPLDSGFHRDSWTQRCGQSILKPELDWEQECIEAPAAIVHGGKVYLFYAGAYNCKPQRIGCAVSADGISFTRVSDKPLLNPGGPGDWNASESGHPYVFERGGRVFLFYQGSCDMGATWRLSRREVALPSLPNGSDPIKIH
ncbi:MAG: hypothetical protein LBS11_09365 [Oscillospiraceae bacterium]|jgi:hypothetical protein|nr:hypothetical protein [Oscillospiraceae bacterium]